VLQTPSADEIVGLASKASTIGTPFEEIGHVDAPGPAASTADEHAAQLLSRCRSLARLQ
jgi:hypothetical protein